MIQILLCILPLLRMIRSEAPFVKKYSTLQEVLVPPPLPYQLHTTAIFGNSWESDSSSAGTWPVLEDRIDPIYVPQSPHLYERKPSAPISSVSVTSSQWGDHLGGDHEDDLYYGPAKYEFGYKIEDSNSWSDFGHREGRLGDLTWGSYEVLLPDGRKQIVEYEADNDGYRPKIRYELDGAVLP